jgi:thiamine-monophosphate kinase
MNNEFDLIKKYFTHPHNRDDVLLSVGDDCASVTVAPDQQLMITTDTLIAGVHFPKQTSAADIAYKAIMVNLSDLAAMGAKPAWLTLAITLPAFDESWLSEFSSTLQQLLQRFNIALIGGDITKGDLSITLQAMGLCNKGKVLQRNQAKPGERIFVTGQLGDAAIGLIVLQNELADAELQYCTERLNRPEARIDFAQELVLYSNCAIDISDGLVADIGHILNASACGAQINLSDIPISSPVRYYFSHYANDLIDWSTVLATGDDYELCFTVAEENVSMIKLLADKHQLSLSCIGEITRSKDLVFLNENKQAVDFDCSGYKHF